MKTVDFTVAPLCEAQISAAAALEAECFADALHPDAFAVFVHAAANRYFAATLPNGTLLGYGGCSLAADEAEILTVAAAPAHRRCGIGRALVRAMLRDVSSRGAKHVYLECRASNEAAQRLYVSLGFAESGRRKNYYTRPREDAVLMALALPDPEAAEC